MAAQVPLVTLRKKPLGEQTEQLMARGKSQGGARMSKQAEVKPMIKQEPVTHGSSHGLK